MSSMKKIKSVVYQDIENSIEEKVELKSKGVSRLKGKEATVKLNTTKIDELRKQHESDAF